MEDTKQKTERNEDIRWNWVSDSYEDPNNKDEWLECPDCGLKPRVWEYDNGRNARCVCGQLFNPKHEVKAKPVGEYVRETGGFSEYNEDKLRENWNAYIKELE